MTFSSQSGGCGFDCAKRNQQTKATNIIFNLISHEQRINIAIRNMYTFEETSYTFEWQICLFNSASYADSDDDDGGGGAAESSEEEERMMMRIDVISFGNLHSFNTIMFVLIFIELV